MEIILRKLTISDVGEKYVDWLNDPEITKYTHIPDHQTLNSVKQFVEQISSSSDNHLYGIFVDYVHVGNIMISRINITDNRAEIGYIIGDKHYWGKGIITKAIEKICEIAFTQLKLRKLYACVYERNLSSQRALLKNNWKFIGRFTKHKLIDGIFQDLLWFEIFNENEYRT